MQAPNRFRQPLQVPIGSLHITGAARAIVTDADALQALSSQKRGDWGSANDWDRNDRELKLRNRVTGVHKTESGCEFWIITDITRCATMIAVPTDYE